MVRKVQGSGDHQFQPMGGVKKDSPLGKAAQASTAAMRPVLQQRLPQHGFRLDGSTVGQQAYVSKGPSLAKRDIVEKTAHYYENEAKGLSLPPSRREATGGMGGRTGERLH